MSYSNSLIQLSSILKGYNDEVIKVITDDESDKEFSDEDLKVLIENIMVDLKDLDRSLI